MKLNRNRSVVAVLVLTIALSSQAFVCSPSSVHEVKVKVDQAAQILNTAAKTNHSMYGSGAYGPVGSPQAIALRAKVAKAIHEANGILSDAVEVAASLKAGDSGASVVALLQEALTTLASVHTGNDRIDLVIQSAVTVLNQAIALAQAIKGK